MDGKKFIEITNNFNKNLNNLQNKINKFETIFDRKDNDIKITSNLYFNKLLPDTHKNSKNIDIGNINNFVNNIFLKGKILYPDKLDFGINNDLVINKIGKVGIHKKDLLDAFSIKNIPIFEFKKLYILEKIYLNLI